MSPVLGDFLSGGNSIMPKRARGGRRERYWRGRRFCGEASQFGGAQDAAHSLAADGEVLFGAKFFCQMRIVEALVLPAR